MRPIQLGGFEEKFAGNTDPWATFTNRDEACKRTAILHAMGAGPWGRVLELGAGNGSNSAAIAPRALRLDATEATEAGTRLVGQAIAPWSARARALQLIVPQRFPCARYDSILIAEILYYLVPDAMRRLAEQTAVALRPGGRLVLAHHRVDYPDFAQHAHGIHDRFLHETKRAPPLRTIRRTGRWLVQEANWPRA